MVQNWHRTVLSEIALVVHTPCIQIHLTFWVSWWSIGSTWMVSSPLTLSSAKDAVTRLFGFYPPRCEVKTFQHLKCEGLHKIFVFSWMIYQLRGAEPFQRNKLALSYATHFAHFMEPEGSSPHSQDPGTCPCCELDSFSPPTIILLLEWKGKRGVVIEGTNVMLYLRLVEYGFFPTAELFYIFNTMFLVAS